MTSRTELFLVPLSAHGGELRVLVRKDAFNDKQVLPHVTLKSDLLQRAAQEFLIREFFAQAPQAELEAWLASPRYKDRIVDTFDRNLLFEGNQSVAIVRAVAIPEELASEAKGVWLPPSALFSHDSLLSDDCKLFARECLNLVPQWVRYTTFPFEILPSMFSIQDLRLLVGMLLVQEIDPGNFHRRLKRLDILRPLVSGQRIHRWEFAWLRGEILRADGLIP